MGRPYDPDVFLGYGERCVEDDHDGQIAALERDLQAAQARIAEVEAERDAAEDEGIAGRRGQNEAEVERDAAIARVRELEEALSWALDCLEITLKRLDTLEPPDCSAASIEHLKIRAAGIRKARAALSGEGANDAD